VARSANSGISAFINQKGEIISTLPYETQGALKGTILANDTKTIYSKYGDFVARIAAFVAVIFLIVGIFVKNKS
jgi:apolipoprotein N-acyltransferase